MVDRHQIAVRILGGPAGHRDDFEGTLASGEIRFVAVAAAAP
jgi:hypothetical protein